MSNFLKVGEGRVVRHKRGGFIKIIIILVLALIILGYFGFDIRDILEKPLVQKNLNYVWNFVIFVWDHYLKTPAVFIWDRVIIDLIWDNVKGVF